MGYYIIRQLVGNAPRVASWRIRDAEYFARELHECQHFTRAPVSKSAVCLGGKLRLLAQKSHGMSGFHLGIRFEVRAKLGR